MAAESDMKVVLVTGPSGAGRSTAINALEDLGFEPIDNLPISLLSRVADSAIMQKPLAIGIDIRNRDFSTHGIVDILEELSRREGLDTELLFLTCDPKVLQLRYSETRRRHPLAPAETPTIGIEREFDLLGPIKSRADILIDTSEMSPHELGCDINKWFSTRKSQKLAVSVQSFSYKRGLPRSVDMLFDCRFLRNPYWKTYLRSQSGQSDAVKSYIRSDERFEIFFAKTLDLIKYLLPAYIEEGKSHLSIGFGCTGGQHRSVAMVEILSAALVQSGWRVSIRHRELERNKI
tara:strand:- start:40 stop:912 length:873 start_codon:yes stop_codon:yes gene_type:complete